jgi:hypothetical protein
MGPEQLRGWVNASGPPGSAAKRVQAAVCLREQERKSGDWQWWMLFFVIVAVVIAVTGAVVNRGRMFWPLTRRSLGSGETFLCKAV